MQMTKLVVVVNIFKKIYIFVFFTKLRETKINKKIAQKK